MQEITEKVYKLIDEFKANNDKNLNGNKAAGKRARKISVELGKALFEYRKVSVEVNKK